MAKRRRASRRFYMFIIGAAVTALACVLVLLLSAPASMEAGGKGENLTPEEAQSIVFEPGITIDGLDVGGLAASAARSAVESELSGRIDGLEFVISDGETSRTVTNADVGAKANLDEAIQSAIGHNQSLLSQKAAKADQEDLLPQQGQGQRDFEVEIAVDRALLVSSIQSFADEFGKRAVEPKVIPRLNDDNRARFTFEEGENGRRLNAEAVADAIIQRLDGGEFQGEIEPVFDVVEPKADVETLKANTKKRSSYSTRFRYSSSDEIIQNRCFNIEKGAQLLNEAVVNPGEHLSFNKRVGLRTEKDGWKLANGISGGKEYTLQAGGGICQVSTTLYNALLCGNIQITDRKAHSIPSDYVPKGLDATVDSGGIDLEFKNNTDSPLYIFAFVTEDKESSRYRYMHVVIYGEPLPSGVEYKARSEIIEEVPRDEPTYVEDPSIPRGYQLTRVIKHDGYVAEAFLDKYENGKLVESKSLGKDKYRGNDAEIAIGTGDPAQVEAPEGAEPATGVQTPSGADGPAPEPEATEKPPEAQATQKPEQAQDTPKADEAAGEES